LSPSPDVVRKVIGSLLNVTVVLLETGFLLFVFGQRFGVASNVRRCSGVASLRLLTISVGQFAGAEGGSQDINSLLTNTGSNP
jgi:hypothetical protein